jgi:antitoxin ParD1/3/4
MGTVDWQHKRALPKQELRDLRAQINEGLADIEAGRVRDFDANRIIRMGEQQWQDHEPSA